jgi:hypothetical protein
MRCYVASNSEYLAKLIYLSFFVDARGLLSLKN